MPDTNSPKVTWTEEDLPIRLFNRDPEQALSHKWSCPRDHTIAAYADGRLRRLRKAWIEFHLSGCQRCRLVVADVVKEQRESDLPVPPVQLVQKAMGLAGRRTALRRWVWAPAGALAGIALLAIATLVLRKPQQLVNVSPPTPGAPLVAKSEPPPTIHTSVKDVVRKRGTAELLPTILFPQTDATMHSDRLQFSWKPIPQSRNYEVRVVRSDGDLVWEGQTDKSALQLPTEVSLKDGFYFVWITAYLENGRTAKSAPVRFLIKR
jgi:putative zinc finger protein